MLRQEQSGENDGKPHIPRNHPKISVVIKTKHFIFQNFFTSTSCAFLIEVVDQYDITFPVSLYIFLWIILFEQMCWWKQEIKTKTHETIQHRMKFWFLSETSTSH